MKRMILPIVGNIDSGMADVDISSDGTISQNSGLISGNELSLRSVGGTTGITSAVSSLKISNVGGGNSSLTNTGNLDITQLRNTGIGSISLLNSGVLTTSGVIINEGGGIDISTSSPITIGTEGISASDNITIRTGSSSVTDVDDSITVNGNVKSTNSGLIALTAGDNNIFVNADIETEGSINLTTEDGEDGNGTIRGTGLVKGNVVTITSLAGIELNISSSILSANGGTGAVSIIENDSVLLSDVTASGALSITTINGSIDTGSELVSSSGNSLQLTANGEGNDIVVSTEVLLLKPSYP